MNNARKTVNTHLVAIVDEQLATAGFTIVFGDEVDPVGHPPCLFVHWQDGDTQGWRSESRARLLQLEVLVQGQNTDLAERAQQLILEALDIRTGTQPKGIIPKLNFNEDETGIPDGTPIQLGLQGGKGWQRLDPPNQQARRSIVTVIVDYIPDRTLQPL